MALSSSRPLFKGSLKGFLGDPLKELPLLQRRKQNYSLWTSRAYKSFRWGSIKTTFWRWLFFSLPSARSKSSHPNSCERHPGHACRNPRAQPGPSYRSHIRYLRNEGTTGPCRYLPSKRIQRRVASGSIRSKTYQGKVHKPLTVLRGIGFPHFT